ncbi:MAG: MarR family transcriptional regulator [Xanthomonadales bacterium]|jgi:DNA-binding MarR family transcriptional regulator|nr:MarR family transcriptional regulator [Xanthomonadales bacterium]
MNQSADAPLSPADRAHLQARSWFAVVNAYQTCERQYARLLAGFGLSIAQFEVLNAIDELGERATPAQIAQRLLVTKGNITGLLKRLSEQQLVEVSPNPEDGRSQRCRLASGVADRLAIARRAGAAFIAEQLAPFTNEQLHQTEVQMKRMSAHLAAMDIDRLLANAQSGDADDHRR